MVSTAGLPQKYSVLSLLYSVVSPKSLHTSMVSCWLYHACLWVALPSIRIAGCLGGWVVSPPIPASLYSPPRPHLFSMQIHVSRICSIGLNIRQSFFGKECFEKRRGCKVGGNSQQQILDLTQNILVCLSEMSLTFSGRFPRSVPSQIKQNSLNCTNLLLNCSF